MSRQCEDCVKANIEGWQCEGEEEKRAVSTQSALLRKYFPDKTIVTMHWARENKVEVIKLLH